MFDLFDSQLSNVFFHIMKFTSCTFSKNKKQNLPPILTPFIKKKSYKEPSMLKYIKNYLSKKMT